MKTLIIHPDDRSTDFLCKIYEDIPEDEKTVMRGGQTKNEIYEAIANHDRVMMMGHGSPQGLFGLGKYPKVGGYIIDQQTVSLLKKKDNNVFIWCNADRFVDLYNIKGFYTGMFISEVSEAAYCGIYETTQEAVTLSNNTFVEEFSKLIDLGIEDTHTAIKASYGVLAKECDVASYNQQRLYFRR